MAPTTQKRWTVQEKGSFDALKFDENAKVPEVGDNDVLVKCKPFDSLTSLYTMPDSV